jgi:uncharacterized protein YbjT (DUF2867 family)
MKIAVTGAFSYSGKYITQKLLSLGHEVITLTGHPHRPDPFNHQVHAYPLRFEESELTRNLNGVNTLYNTYWIRFDYGQNTQAKAVENTHMLLRAAKNAGVSRVVHISITNPSLNSTLPYFQGKAFNEQAVIESGMSYAILRPTVLFGTEDILINNIAWLLRRFPFFTQIGDGKYRLQPVFVGDLAGLSVEAGEMSGDFIWDAVGPDIFTFDELVTLIANSIHRPVRLIHVSPKLALAASKIFSTFVGDIMLTRDEADGLMAGLLISNEPPRGLTRLSDWLNENTVEVGVKYASEIKRHY